MEELIEIINNIVKYGLKPNIEVKDKEKELEENLVRIYAKSFEIEYEFDPTEYGAYDKEKLFPNVIQNIKSNFQDFGLYHSVLHAQKISEEPANAMGDAIDDLSDIIYDLLEVKWRNENNSEADAWWCLEFAFNSYIKHHLVDLLNYILHRRRSKKYGI